MKIAKNRVLVTLIAVFGIISAPLVYASGSDKNNYKSNHSKNARVLAITGIPVTGANRLLGEPLRDYGTVLGVPVDTLGFAEMAEYNPGQIDPLPITTVTDMYAVLASFIDPALVEFFGGNPNDFDKSFNNIPLNKMKTVVSRDNFTRATLPDITDSEPLSNSVIGAKHTITLGDWLAAKGKSKIKCKNGVANVRMKMKNLVPMRAYTVWAVGVRRNTGPILGPLGGAPNVFITDKEGKGEFNRKLNYCPMDVNEESQVQLLALYVLLHSDHMIYGTVPSPEQIGFYGGSISHAHMEFALTGELINSMALQRSLSD